MNSIVMPGTRMRYGNQWWTVGAVGNLFVGERYYWLTRKNEVAMLPAECVEKPTRPDKEG